MHKKVIFFFMQISFITFPLTAVKTDTDWNSFGCWRWKFMKGYLWEEEGEQSVRAPCLLNDNIILPAGQRECAANCSARSQREHQGPNLCKWRSGYLRSFANVYFLRERPGKHYASKFTGFTRMMQFCFTFFSILCFLYFYFTVVCLCLDQTVQGQSCWTVGCPIVGLWEEHSCVSLLLPVVSYLCSSEIQVVIVLWPYTWKGKTDHWKQNFQTKLTALWSFVAFRKDRWQSLYGSQESRKDNEAGYNLCTARKKTKPCSWFIPFKQHKAQHTMQKKIRVLPRTV